MSPFEAFGNLACAYEDYLENTEGRLRSGVRFADTTSKCIYAPNQRLYAHYVGKPGQDGDQRLKAQREHDVRGKFERPNCAAHRSPQIRRDFHRANRLVSDALSGSTG